jgi:hypothetical protein
MPRFATVRARPPEKPRSVSKPSLVLFQKESAMSELTPVTALSSRSRLAQDANSRTSPSTVFRTLFESSKKNDFAALADTIHDECEWVMMSNRRVVKGKRNIVALCKAGKLASEKSPEIMFDVATAQWGVFEYLNRGVITRSLCNFAAASGWQLPAAPATLVGRRYAAPVCFVYRTNAQRKIYLLQEYFDLGSLTNQFL